MIQGEGLTISYHGRPLFEKATFSLQPGERCGLVGRNGSGKTTLFRLLVGQETPDAGNIAIRKNYVIGTLNQHIRFTRPTLLEEACLGLRPEDQDSIYKAERVLFGLGFSDEDMDRSPADLSGGYQLRLHLTKLLVGEPDCLLLDEPTNYLDIVSIRWFTRFLQQWRGEFILITHDREFMDSVTTHTMGIHRERLLKVAGDTVAFFNQILLQEEVHERTRQKMEKKRAHAQDYIDRFGAKASKAAQAQSRMKMMQRIPTLEKLKDLYQLNFEFNEAAFPGKMMLEAQNLSFSYEDQDVRLIQDLSFSIETGQRVGIIGKNGRGKSTILRLLAQELTPQSGTLRCSERLRCGYFGQTNIDRLHPRHTVEQEIALANPQLNITQVKALCGLMMFSDAQAGKLTSVLSGGERSRVLLGKILASPCNLLLLDEPTHHLDIESIEALIDALEDFHGGVVIVTHSELILKRLCLDKLVVCRQHVQELFVGDYEAFLEKDGWHDAAEGVKPKKKPGDQRDTKQLRAELVMARAQAVKGLDLEIAQKEKLITEMEVGQQKAHQELARMATESGGLDYQELAKTIATRQKNLESLYDSLDRLVQDRDERYQAFSKQLDEIV